tara:strand:- start:1314 stop:1625 length:312 start_codon:yes stop_codon:yes gene_type:complete
MDNKEIKGLKTLFQSKDENDWELALVIMKGLNLTPDDVSKLLTVDDFIKKKTINGFTYFNIRELACPLKRNIGSEGNSKKVLEYSQKRSKENIENLINKNNGE